MSRISREDLKRIAEAENRLLSGYKAMLMVCTGTDCVSARGFEVLNEFKKILKEKNLDKDYIAIGTGCNDFCAVGPIVVVQPEGIFYQKVQPEDAAEIVESHLEEGKVVERLLYSDSVSESVNKTTAEMDDRTCMVDVARHFVDFLVDDCCGKCTPCREGLFALHSILERICSGEGQEGDIELMEEISRTIIDTSLCQWGRSAPDPVLSTIRYFREDYEEHIKEKRCRAGVCKALIRYRITDNCTGCALCFKQCPVAAITGEARKLHLIDPDTCIKCGICYEVCKFNAVEVI